MTNQEEIGCKGCLLAEFLGDWDCSELQEWSDGTFTPISDDAIEWHVLSGPNKHLARFLGKHNGYYIYEN